MIQKIIKILEYFSFKKLVRKNTKKFTILKVFGNHFSAKSDFQRFCRINGRMGKYYDKDFRFEYLNYPIVIIWKYIHENNQETFKGLEMQSVWIDECVDNKYDSFLNSRVRNS